MTAIISFVYDDCIQLLTDGAAYEGGILKAVVHKYYPASSVPFVITGRGNRFMVDHIAKHAIEFCNKACSVDDAFHWLGLAAESVFDRVGDIGTNHFEIYGLGYSETEGFVQKGLSSHAENGFPAGELVTLGEQLVAAPWLSPAQAKAIRAGERPESDSTFFERRGVEMMEYMRQDLSEAKVSFKAGEELSVVGGFCALTTITRAGVSSRVLKRWDDPIGERINPYRHIENVTVLGNRKQRRAAKGRAA